ncbi:glycosyltransferase family 4 protein [Fictibacillus sp. 7GRE50]|uniref:glycosyltransferase family 4 protein n=1 Tax=Fictibacillus sp. 7GRE50 TaxID=2745878 RepID=UPI0018CCBFFE|nr:glycosyltransferase family 4 protein [Fictibacillus sp. 7GRE50]MBH0164078.1 glycosyltransferase family 4 protein [Fictibacillus sp. 7GRE50]
MKLWIFNHYAISPGSGGITRDYDLSSKLIKKGHEVTIFASSFDHRTRTVKHSIPKGKTYKEEYYDGIRYVWIKTTPYYKNDHRRVLNILSYTFRGYFAAKKIKGQPDFVMGTIVHPFAAFLGYAISRYKKSMFYFEERDLWPETLIHLGKFSRSNPFVKFLYKLEKFLYKKADRIVVLFDKAVNYVESRGIDTKKVVYLPNGADLERYEKKEPLENDIEQVMQSLKDKNIAIYTGAHGLANNLDPLLDTAKILQNRNENVHFVFVGDGVEKARLIKRTEEEGIHNITFLPPIPKEQIPSILMKADIGLISMWDADLYKWGMSLNKAYDYMAASLPTAILCNIPQTIVETSGGGVKVGTVDELADSLSQLAGNQEAKERMGALARTFVEENYSWQNLANRLIHVMEEDYAKKENLMERGNN